jgi:chromate transporter
MIATTVKMARPLLRDHKRIAPLVALVTFAAIGVMQWSLPLVLLVVAPLSVALAWWTRA